MANYHHPEKIADCCLCKEIETGIFPAEYASVYGVDKRICFESDNFIVIPSVSPIATGHTMLLPKQHYTSMMACPKEMKEEALTLIDSLYANLSDRFGQLFLFEHGVGRLDDVACGINHAHLHFVPLSTQIANLVIKDIRCELGELVKRPLLEQLFEKATQEAYLMFGAAKSEMYLSKKETIPSQLIRKMLAFYTNNPSWDWRSIEGHKAFCSTLNDLIKFCYPLAVSI